jgi:hypothetical protein
VAVPDQPSCHRAPRDAAIALTLVPPCGTVVVPLAKSASSCGIRLREKNATMDGRFQDKVIVVTGAAGGPARATAVRFASEGCAGRLSCPCDDTV